MRAINGKIAIKTWDRAQVFIHAVKKAKEGSKEEAEEQLKATTVEIEETHSGLVIRTRRPDKWKWFKSWRVSIDYEITVPKRVRLDLETVNGSISIPPTTGDAKSKTVNGSIKISGTRGAVNAETVNGSITMNGIRGAIDAQTVNGQIDLTKIRGGVNAETVNSSIKIEIVAQTQDDIRAEAVNGRLQLSLPSDFRGHIQAESTRGHIDTEFPITVKGRIGKSISGNLNGGNGARIRLETINGGIDIKHLQNQK